MSDDPIADFDDFLNEPPEHEDKRNVRDFRHEAYAKWAPIRAELQRLRAAQEWQPIATAKRDGSEVLVATALGFRYLAMWSAADPDIDLREGWFDDRCRRISPAHWFPLPPPPKD